MTAEEMLDEFKEKEYLSFMEIGEVDYKCIPSVTITFSDSGCCDHETYIKLYANEDVVFNRFSCDIKNTFLMINAIKCLMKELGWLDE